jgi:hypothetical protein
MNRASARQNAKLRTMQWARIIRVLVDTMASDDERGKRRTSLLIRAIERQIMADMTSRQHREYLERVK